MGFASPATDYIEQRVTPASICTTADSRILETSAGYAVNERVSHLEKGQVLLILSGGRTQFAKFAGKALITHDEEAIEGEAAEDVEVLGGVTFFIDSTDADDIPV